MRVCSDANNDKICNDGTQTIIATFTYDGDGKRVISDEGGEVTVFVGTHYEVKNPGSGQTVTKYYYAGATRIASRKYTVPQEMAVEYLLGDHLGSASITTDADGDKVSEIRYKPWGEVRYAWKDPNLSTTPAFALTKYTFTGQFTYMDDPTTVGVTEGFGWMYYNARWYDPVLSRFNQADTIIPGAGNVQAWDRYSYTSNNPVKNIDPSGHTDCQSGYDPDCAPGKGAVPTFGAGDPRYQRAINRLIVASQQQEETPVVTQQNDDVCFPAFRNCYRPDAALVEVSGSINYFGKYLTGGADWLALSKEDLPLYAYYGEGNGLGAGYSLTYAIGLVFNVDEAADYEDSADVYGVTVGGFTVVYTVDANIDPLEQGATQSVAIGQGPGPLASVWVAKQDYFHIWTAPNISLRDFLGF